MPAARTAAKSRRRTMTFPPWFVLNLSFRARPVFIARAPSAEAQRLRLASGGKLAHFSCQAVRRTPGGNDARDDAQCARSGGLSWGLSKPPSKSMGGVRSRRRLKAGRQPRETRSGGSPYPVCRSRIKPCSRMRMAVCASCSRLPASHGSSEITCSATSACRSVGTSIASPGEPRRAETKEKARGALHGFRMTRGWVVTRMNS